MDGATGAIQSKMKAGHSTKSYDMMLNMNMWSVVYLAVGLAFGEAYHFFLFASRNPHVLSNIVIFGMASALGQASFTNYLNTIFNNSNSIMILVVFGEVGLSLSNKSFMYF